MKGHWRVGDRVVNRARGFRARVAEVYSDHVLVVGDGRKHYEHLALWKNPAGYLTDAKGVVFKRDMRRR